MISMEYYSGVPKYIVEQWDVRQEIYDRQLVLNPITLKMHIRAIVKIKLKQN